MHFYFDENIPISIANALSEIETTLGNTSTSTIKIPELGKRASDESIVEYLLALGTECVLVTQDSDFRKGNLVTLILNSSNIGLVVFDPPKRGYPYFKLFQFMVKKWGDVQRLSHDDFPFGYRISPRSLTKI